MDLSAFAGHDVRISFLFASDGFVNYDGFYFDDLEIAYLDSTVSKVVTLPLEKFRLLPGQPNPAASFTVVRWEADAGMLGSAELVVVDALGRPVHRQTVDLGGPASTTLDTRAWTAGVYSYYLRQEGLVSTPAKLTVLH
jgi:hypothetical protein